MKRSYFQLFFLMFFSVISAHSQESKIPSLNYGALAPALRLSEWVKGKPVEHFERGTVYLVEFWATWCKPCKAMIPRLSQLAHKYRRKLIVIGIDIYEKKPTPLEKIKYFVDSMGRRMNYRVAIEDSNFMETAWLDAAAEKGIPKSFVVDAEGRLAWIGHPMYLHQVLPDILNNHWNINEAMVKRNSDRYLEQLDDSLNFDLNSYNGKLISTYGQPDSSLEMIAEIIKKEPRLAYAPSIARNTFASLLKTDIHKANEYGKKVLVSRTYDDPAYDAIINNIQWYSDKITIPAEIYELGAEAYQLKVDDFKQYPEYYDLFSYYNKMAEWYWRAGDKSKAIRAEKKAIKALKKNKTFL
ncbi:MAG TPA: TlpA disulfide reductase family protein [Puia sp.]|nr:TlpA disulfide reductase family protein [Puia sp.]